jgi:hypothetical protein
VRDEQQRAAGVAQLARDAEQVRAFALRQRRGGLIEDQHARLVDQRARDLHHVLLRDAERRHGVSRSKSAPSSRSTAAARALQLAPVDEPRRADAR